MTKLETEGRRIYLSPPHGAGDELAYVAEAINSNFIAPAGPLLRQFEDKFRALTGFKHCTAVSSGSAAIHLALRCVGVEAGDVVLASTFTFIGSVAAVHHMRAELHFVDSEAATGNMDPVLLEQALVEILASGRKPAAVLPTDVYGQSVDLDAIATVCDKFGIPIVSDSAESLGASYRGQAAGYKATVAAFSFNGNKIITTGGGGMIASNDKEIVDECAYLATQARSPGVEYDHQVVGYNYRLSNILAGLGLAQLGVLEQRVKAKRKIHETYKSALAGTPGISFLEEMPSGVGNRWLTVVLINEEKFGASPEQVRLELERQNIEARPAWKPMHQQPCFRGLKVTGGSVADKLHASGLCLPSGTSLQVEDIQRVADIVLKTPLGLNK